MKKKKILWERILAAAAALLLWQIAAMLLNQQILLVTPVRAAMRLIELAGEAGFWQTVCFSFLRIEAGFLSGLILGALLAALSARFHVLEVILWPYLSAVKTVPVASFIILSLVVFSAQRLSVFISFLMVFPIVYFNLLQGMKSTDPKLLQMAEVFELPWYKKVYYIYLPQLEPFLYSACSAALGISWKAGIAAEVIGIPAGSIGERLYEAKVYLATADLLAWTMVVVLVSILFEKLFLRLLLAIAGKMKRC